ncbi:interleukin-5-like [Anas acuta]|uniref:interleukin-5-like n=1 Tax=Anas acuta TaxID=28680 RepID=UPI0035C90553
MVEDQPRSTDMFSEHIRAMRTHLYLIFLAAGIYAAPHISNIAELLSLLQQMKNSMTGDSLNLRIETPASIDNVNCIDTLFEGVELLKNNSDLKKFSVFFQKFERLKQSLIPSPAEEGECETERRNTTKFIEKLITFIRKLSKGTKA